MLRHFVKAPLGRAQSSQITGHSSESNEYIYICLNKLHEIDDDFQESSWNGRPACLSVRLLRRVRHMSKYHTRLLRLTLAVLCSPFLSILYNRNSIIIIIKCCVSLNGLKLIAIS